MSKNVKQRDITDCGAACLASVAAYYHLKMPQFAKSHERSHDIIATITTFYRHNQDYFYHAHRATNRC